jgi:cyclopropane-fatty-acyl-phospholipid synthase
MSVQQEQAVTPSVASGKRSLAETVLRRILQRLACGQLIVETPVGERLVFNGAHPGPHARLTIHRWRCIWRFATGSDVGFAEAYRAGEWSSPNLNALFNLACANDNIVEPTWFHSLLGCGRRIQHALNRNTRRGSRRNISAHYDLGNDFYRQWLDAGMSYSSALFSSTGQTLDEAQNAKLDRILDLLDMAGRERVLEIGFGWGSLAERMLDRSECTLTGLTLSTEQMAWATRRLNHCGLLDRCDLRLQDYRDVSGEFDRIVSIEMLEAVGAEYWPKYFEILQGRLRSGGIAVIQVITIDECLFEAYRRRPDFIQNYIFPGGMLPTTRIVEKEATKAGLQVVTREFFGDSYARTLDEWQRRFQKSWSRLEGMGFDERFKRTWEYYLAYCQAGFETRALNVGLYKLAR